MDRESISGAAGRNSQRKRRKKGGLKLFQQDGSWHVTGTLRIDGRSVRIRKSLGLPADRPDHEAEAARAKLETEKIAEALSGVCPSRAFAAVALEWLQYVQPGPADVMFAKIWTKYFGMRLVRDIRTEDVTRFVCAKLSSRSPATVNRYINNLHSILQFSVRMGWTKSVPHIERPKIKKATINKFLSIEELERLLELTAPHAANILALMMVTGCRVSEAVYLQISDVSLAEGRERVVFRNTKNGTTRGAVLHRFAIPFIEAAIKGRQEGPVFFTHRGKPYREKEGEGGQIKTAFHHARARLVQEMAAAGKSERAKLIAKSSPHWLRHSFASLLIAQGVGIKTVMEAGGWKTSRLVMETYGHLAPDATRDAVTELDFGGNRAGDDTSTRRKQA